MHLTDTIETQSELARSSFLNERLNEALENGKDIWKELRNFELFPTPKSDLHGFSLDDLNTSFAGVSYSSTEYLQKIMPLIETASTEVFKFRELSLNDTILAVKNFRSQATGTDNFSHKIFAKSLPTKEQVIFLALLLFALKKVSTPSQASDFIPVALFCFLSKVLGKLAHNQITTYLTEKKLLDPLQTGIHQYSSFETAFAKINR